MDDRLRADPPAGLQIRIRTIVTGGPGGDRGYEISLGHGADGVHLLTELGAHDGHAGTPAVAPAPSEEDDATTITFRTDPATATAIATGAEGAQAAFMAGRLRVDGDTRLLMAHQDALRALDDVFAPVRARTDFDLPGSGPIEADPSGRDPSGRDPSGRDPSGNDPTDPDPTGS